MNPRQSPPDAHAPVGTVVSGGPLAGDRWHPRRLAPLAVLACATVAVTLRDPHLHGSWGVCPTYALFGVYCPGCGSLRALHDLAAGRIAESMGHNILVLPAIAFLVFSAVGRPRRYWSRVWLVVLVVFTLLRNLPGSPLAP